MRTALLATSDDVPEIATHINAELTLRGPWFFQLKPDSRGGWKLLEISCRVAGSVVAQRARGVSPADGALGLWPGRSRIRTAVPQLGTSAAAPM
jgi:hypothetical protein